MFGMGLGEILLFLLLILLTIAARRLPDTGRTLGDAIEDVRQEDEE